MKSVELTASDVMSTKLASIAPDANIQLAAKLMLKRKVSALLVLDAKRRLLGICSEGDLVHRIELGSRKKGSWWLNLVARDKDMARDYARAFGRRVSDAMTRHVVSVDPKTPLSSVAALMDRHKIKRVPVLEDGRVVGLVARADLLEALVRVAGQAAVEKGMSDVEALGEIRKRMTKESWAGTTLASVTVRGGVAKFAGIVASIAQRDALRAMAENVAGVRHVDVEELHVDKAATSLMHSLPLPLKRR
jgi:CBS-domain-containing membrane protein